MITDVVVIVVLVAEVVVIVAEIVVPVVAVPVVVVIVAAVVVVKDVLVVVMGTVVLGVAERAMVVIWRIEDQKEKQLAIAMDSVAQPLGLQGVEVLVQEVELK